MQHSPYYDIMVYEGGHWLHRGQTLTVIYGQSIINKIQDPAKLVSRCSYTNRPNRAYNDAMRKAVKEGRLC